MLQLWFFSNTLLWSFNVEIGGLRLGLNVIVLLLLGSVWFWQIDKISSLTKKMFLVLLVYMPFSFLVAVAGPCTDKFSKFGFTAPVIILLILLGVEIGSRASENDWVKLQKVALLMLFAAFAGFFVEFLLPGAFPGSEKYRLNGSYSGLFSEPSHVAFTMFPSIVILLLAEKKIVQRIGFLALFGLLIFSRSSTLIALSLSWMVYRGVAQGKFGKAIITGIGITFFVGLMSLVDYDSLVEPTVSRVSGVLLSQNETENLSSLVYLQGWQDVWANFFRTNGFGLGFNMMGCSPLLDVPARVLISEGLGSELNSEDGSFLFSKLTSETGFVGIALLLILFWWLIKVEEKVRVTRFDMHNRAIVVQSTLIVYFLVSSILRGGGYFNTVLLISVVAVSGSVKWYKNNHSETQSIIGKT